jgi:hypothetical protein
MIMSIKEVQGQLSLVKWTPTLSVKRTICLPVLSSELLHKRPFVLKRTYVHLFLLAFASTLFCVVVTLWTVAHFRSGHGLNPGSFRINIDDVNEIARTIIPVLAIIVLKSFCP